MAGRKTRRVTVRFEANPHGGNPIRQLYDFFTFPGYLHYPPGGPTVLDSRSAHRVAKKFLAEHPEVEYVFVETMGKKVFRVYHDGRIEEYNPFGLSRARSANQGFFDPTGRGEQYIRLRRYHGKLTPDRVADRANLARIGWHGSTLLTDADVDKIHDLIAKSGWHYGVEVLEPEENPFGLARARSESLFGMLGGHGITRPPVPADRPSGKSHLYKGVRLTPVAGGWMASVDPDTLFEDLRQAKRFVNAWMKRRNVRGAGNAA